MAVSGKQRHSDFKAAGFPETILLPLTAGFTIIIVESAFSNIRSKVFRISAVSTLISPVAFFEAIFVISGLRIISRMTTGERSYSLMSRLTKLIRSFLERMKKEVSKLGRPGWPGFSRQGRSAFRSTSSSYAG